MESAIILVIVVCIVLVCAVAYLSYLGLSALRKDTLSVDEANKMIEQVNKLIAELQQADAQAATRIAGAQTTAGGAVNQNAETKTRVDGIDSRVVAAEREIGGLSTQLGATAQESAVNKAAIQSQETRLVTLESTSVTDDEMAERVASAQEGLKTVIAGEYVKVLDLNQRFLDLSTTLSTSALQITDASGRGAGTVAYDSDESAFSFVTGTGGASVKLGPGGLAMNGGLLKVTEDGSERTLVFCGDGTAASCRSIVPVPPAAPPPPAAAPPPPAAAPPPPPAEAAPPPPAEAAPPPPSEAAPPANETAPPANETAPPANETAPPPAAST
jgi:hypothetical protein